MDYLYTDDTKKILKVFYDVYNELGYGFLEKVYKNALYAELVQQGFNCRKEYPISVYYKGICVGERPSKNILPEHLAQLTNYLRATNAEVGLLLNFGPLPEQKRIVFTNDRKIKTLER